MFPEVDPVLGPGDALDRRGAGHGRLASAWPSTRRRRPRSRRCRCEGTVLITVADTRQAGRAGGGAAVRRAGLHDQGHRGHARVPGASTASRAEPILKMHEGRPNIVDAIKNGEIQLVINTPARQAEQARRLLHPQGGHQVQGPLHHDAGRGRWPRPRASPPAARPRGRQEPAGVPRGHHPNPSYATEGRDCPSNKDLRSIFGPKFPLHLYELVDSPKASGQGDAEAVEQDLLGFVRLGDAPQADGAVVVALPWCAVGSTTSPLLILASSSSTVRGASPRPDRRIHWASVFHNT